MTMLPPASYRVLAPHFTAGIEFSAEGEPVRAAPILAWVIKRGWLFRTFEDYCSRKGWQIERLAG